MGGYTIACVTLVVWKLISTLHFLIHYICTSFSTELLPLLNRNYKLVVNIISLPARLHVTPYCQATSMCKYSHKELL